jgi:hypothetical protein
MEAMYYIGLKPKTHPRKNEDGAPGHGSGTVTACARLLPS